MDSRIKIMSDLLENVLNYKLIADHVKTEKNPEMLNGYVSLINQKMRNHPEICLTLNFHF